MASAHQYLSASRQRAREGHLPLARQLLEMLLLELVYQIGPGFYHKARFWRRDIPFRTKTRYCVGKRYLKAVTRLNNPVYHKLSQHKVAEKALLSLFGIPTAKFFGYFHESTGRSSDGRLLTTAAEFLALLRRHALDCVAIKKPEGSCGTGFDIVEYRDDGGEPLYSRALERRFFAEAYLQRKAAEYDGQGILVESVITQHPALAYFNSSSVNTLRMWVLQSGSQVDVRSALLKIGKPDSLTDYTPRGGMAMPVEIATGILGEPKFRSEADREAFDCEILKDYRIPSWSEAVTLAQKSLAVLPNIHFAGMDIAITSTGPLVVELNVQPDPGHAAQVGIPTLDLLGL